MSIVAECRQIERSCFSLKMNSQSENCSAAVVDDGVSLEPQLHSLATDFSHHLNLSDGQRDWEPIEPSAHQEGRCSPARLGGPNDLNSDDVGSEGSDADTELPQEPTNDGNVDLAPVTNAPTDQFVCPDDELVEKIVKQVEYYFSDENITTDAYLLKHIKRNKQGYVSIKVLSTFRKTKKLSKDPRVIAYALQKSDKLQVNEPGTKVRRIDPLPMTQTTLEVDWAQRTVVASNLAMENPSIESVLQQFSKCGSITQVRILRPGNSIPTDVKKYLDKHLEVGSNSVYALVEYEDLSSATKACKTLTNTGDWRRGMRVVMLIPPAKKDDAKNNELKGNKEDKVQDSDGVESGESKKKQRKKKRNSRVMELAQGESPYSSGSDVDRRKSPCRDNADSTAKGKFAGGSPKSSPKGSPTSGRRSGNICGRSPLVHDSENEDWRSRSSSFGTELGTSPSQSLSPWIQRRLKAQQDSAGSPPGRSPVLGRRSGDTSSVLPEADFHKMAENDRILRQPRGPDGTRGFKMNRSTAVITNCN